MEVAPAWHHPALKQPFRVLHILVQLVRLFKFVPQEPEGPKAHLKSQF